MNYNLSDKYIINLSGRRDGSSRFGPAGNSAISGAGAPGYFPMKSWSKISSGSQLWKA